MPRRSPTPKQHTITINRAPALTLWATVVANQLGFDWDEALTVGRVVGGLNAHPRDKAPTLFHPRPEILKTRRQKLKPGESLQVGLLQRAVAVVRTPEGLRAMTKDTPIAPAGVQRYLESKFGDSLQAAVEAMVDLARSLPPEELGERACELYEQFRPELPEGAPLWGAEGTMDLTHIHALARPR